MLNDCEYWLESAVLHCFCTEWYIMCLIQLVQLLGAGHWMLPYLDIWGRHQTNRDWFKETFSKPKLFQILNFFCNPCHQNDDYQLFDSDVATSQGNIVELQKTDNKRCLCLAGHHCVMKQQCNLNFVRRIYNRWWYILKCLLLCMVAVGNSGSTIETCRTLYKRIPHALWAILGVVERRRLCRTQQKDQNILVSTKGCGNHRK